MKNRKKFQTVSETEMDIMEVLWDIKKPMTCKELLTYFSENKDKEWKNQTMSTFLTRLVNKGILAFETKKNVKHYYPLLTKKQYHQKKTKNILNSMYDGSIKNFMAALYSEEDDIPYKELEDIKEWFLKK